MEVVKCTVQTPIEIALGIDENGNTTARKLYAWLELRPGDYSRWVKQNVTENPYAEEGKEYSALVRKTSEQGGRPSTDYLLSASFAKKLAMASHSPKGEETRDYFIKVEKVLVNKAKAEVKVQEKTTAEIAGMQELSKSMMAMCEKLTEVLAFTTKAMEAMTASATASSTKSEPVAKSMSSYADIIRQREYPATVTAIAKDYGSNAINLNRLLADFGIQSKEDGVWRIAPAYACGEYTQELTYTNWGTGEKTVSTKWTRKGNEFIYNFLKSKGMLPLCEQ